MRWKLLDMKTVKDVGTQLNDSSAEVIGCTLLGFSRQTYALACS